MADPPSIAGYDKPTADQVLRWVAEAIARGLRSNIQDPEALASMVLRELRAHDVKLVVHKFEEGPTPVYRPTTKDPSA